MEEKNNVNKHQSTSPTETLSFDSPYFDQFTEMLTNNVYHYRLNTFGCDHTFKQTTWVLTFLNLDIEKSIKFLEKYGGFCDCQVLIHVNKNNIKKIIKKTKNINKQYTFEEATIIVNERDESICQNCGDIVVYPWIARLTGHPQDFDPEHFILVCGRCFQNFAKRKRELSLM